MANDPGRERLITSILLGAAGLVTVIVLLVHSMTVSGVSRFPEAGGGKAGVVEEASLGFPMPESADEPYSYDEAGNILLFDPGRAPVLARLGKRVYKDSAESSGWYISFSYYRENRDIYVKKILPDSVADVSVSFRRWGNGYLYFILDQHRLFRASERGSGVMEITRSLFQKQPRLRPNVTSIEFVDKGYGDGLALHLKSGKMLYFYPRINRLYTQPQPESAAVAQ